MKSNNCVTECAPSSLSHGLAPSTADGSPECLDDETFSSSLFCVRVGSTHPDRALQSGDGRQVIRLVRNVRVAFQILEVGRPSPIYPGVGIGEASYG